MPALVLAVVSTQYSYLAEGLFHSEGKNEEIGKDTDNKLFFFFTAALPTNYH